MTRTSTARRGARPRPTTWGERLFVLGGLGLAALATAAALALGTDTGLLAPLWLAALAWTVLASLAGALRRGIAHGDWSAFARHDFPDDRHDAIDFQARTGTYAWLGDHEDRLLDDDEHLR